MTTAQSPTHLRYSLSYDDVYEAFRLVLHKRDPWIRYGATVLLCCAAAALLVQYARNPLRIEYPLLALLAALMLFRVLGYPELKARRSAKRVNRLGGTYEVTLYAQGQIQANAETRLELNGDKNARAFETERLFVIRPDRWYTFAIPKRAISPQESEIIRRTLESRMRRFSRTFDRRNGAAPKPS